MEEEWLRVRLGLGRAESPLDTADPNLLTSWSDAPDTHLNQTGIKAQMCNWRGLPLMLAVHRRYLGLGFRGAPTDEESISLQNMVQGPFDTVI